ncbi:ubiquitin carboxyl-terminal hydrolase 3-like isoform X2 [Babylonia areolata]|uniref:ubiquitin carboxyl-terminal hydrolase 3-like isoform X2 n=1 Tax=Babylonia areolata TaxID=304850 RepID=UPI003FD41EBA
MECPHLEECARILEPNFQTENNPQEFVCSVCNTEKSPWICLQCGIINCGRYVNAHAKKHFEETESEKHHVCMDCHDYMAFCYTCDEFVINDTAAGHLEKLRKSFESLSRLAQKSQSPQKRKKGKRSGGASAGSSENDNKRRKKEEKKLSRPPRTPGLRNLGNTCFMNAVLQSLSNIQYFCGYIKQLPSLEDKAVKVKKYNPAKKSRDLGEDALVVEELRKILVALWQGNKTAISPESLFNVIWKVVPRFRGYQQQDAHEFMRYLLDRMHSELLQLLPYPTSNSQFITQKSTSTIVTAIFGGLLQNEVKCLICGIESKKHDPFLDLSLDIPSQFAVRQKPKEGDPVCKLSDCLHSFTDVEELEESELYMCSSCKRRQRSTKKFWIRRLPNVLCLHLKRFRWSTYCRVKLETFVEFPLSGLDMNCYVLDNLHETRGSGAAGSNLYDLAAVIVHHGSGAGSGHYTSYATHEGQWYHFNDSTVTACEPEVVARCKAYILFYVRRQTRLPEYLMANNNGNAAASTSGRYK